MKSFYTIKKDQTHTYDKNGKRLFITRLIAKSLPVTQIKTQEKDGYQSLQIAIGSKKRITKPISGHLKNLDLKPQYLREIKSENIEKNIGEQIKVSDIFAIGDNISVKSKAKGRGFSGGMKRWGFHGGPKTHGQSDRQRAPGAIGQGTTPGRIYKGKKMAGRYGGKNLNIRGGQIIHIDEQNQELWITGTVPGAKGGLVEIRKLSSGTFVGLPETKVTEKLVEKPKLVEEKTETEPKNESKDSDSIVTEKK